MKKTFSNRLLQGLILIVLFLMIILLGINFFRETARNKNVESELTIYHSLTNQYWPEEFLDEKFMHLKQKKVIYAYSANDCEQCTITHLKFLKMMVEQKKRIGENHIQILGSGYLIPFTYPKYQKVFELAFPSFMDTSEVLLNKFQSVDLPFFAILDENNKILYSWKAEPEKLILSDHILQKHF